MKACILSDDSFFNLGLASILAEAGFKTFVLDSIIDNNSFNFYHSKPYVVIIDTNNHERSNRILHKEAPSKYRIVVISGNDGINKKKYFNISLPEVDSCKEIVTYIKRYIAKDDIYYCRLSEREKTILYLLLKGVSPSTISKRLNISVKTISAHKVNALRKLGIRRMTSQSLLYLNDYLNKEI